MPALAELLAKRAGVAWEALSDTAAVVAEGEIFEQMPSLEKRINIPCCNASSPAGLVTAETVDPWQRSGKYALGWVYFCIILLALTAAMRWYNFWNDKIRVAVYKEEMEEAAKMGSPDTDYELSALSTDKSTRKFFPREGPLPSTPPKEHSAGALTRISNIGIALCRWLFYHPIPAVRLRKGWRPIVFPSIGAIAIVASALVFVLLYCFVPQPLYWQSIAFGSPPIAIRAGMIAVAMMPWIVGLAMKPNFISILTGIGHERLNVLHRWLAYICLLLSLIHTVPFYVQPVWDRGGQAIFQSFFTQGFYVYGTGGFELIKAFRIPANAIRHRCACAVAVFVHTLPSATATPFLRAVRRGPRTRLDCPACNAVLALPQLPHLMGLPVRYHGHLARFIRVPGILSQLD